MGPLVKRSSGEFMSGGPTTYNELENEFVDAATDPAVKGILVAIDSPGGESVGALELSDLIYSQRGSKPIYAVADGDAFSAAYAVASAAEKVYVLPSGGVGSVGVFMMHLDQSGFNATMGVKPTYIFAGAHKVDGNPHAPLTDEARATFQGEVDRIYRDFSATVARNRGMDKKAVRATEAGLYFGRNGVDIGFADEVGGIAEAVTGLRAVIAAPKNLGKATALPRKDGNKMEDVQEAVVMVAAVPEVVLAPAIDVGAIESAMLAYAADVTDFCTLAGMPGRAAAYIRTRASIESVRTELQTARAAADAEAQINSHVLPEAGAETSAPGQARSMSESPIVMAAQRLADAGKERK
jgi:signal peptide peptidase SppA